jgi:hypothetical protein
MNTVVGGLVGSAAGSGSACNSLCLCIVFLPPNLRALKIHLVFPAAFLHRVVVESDVSVAAAAAPSESSPGRSSARPRRYRAPHRSSETSPCHHRRLPTSPTVSNCLSSVVARSRSPPFLVVANGSVGSHRIVHATAACMSHFFFLFSFPGGHGL